MTTPSQQETTPPVRDPVTGEPLPPKQQPGYYPGFSTLAQQKFWDAATRRTVLDRVTQVPPQSDRAASRRIPILPFMDDRLFSGKISGFRYEDMPPDGDAYRLGIQAIEQMAREVHGRSFPDCSYTQREVLLQSLNDGKPAGALELWGRMNVTRFWRMLLHDAAIVYYAHPWAWDEIGFGGPAYPRGYMRLGGGKPEPWEVDEQRYAWDAPEGAESDLKEKF